MDCLWLRAGGVAVAIVVVYFIASANESAAAAFTFAQPSLSGTSQSAVRIAHPYPKVDLLPGLPWMAARASRQPAQASMQSKNVHVEGSAAPAAPATPAVTYTLVWLAMIVEGHFPEGGFCGGRRHAGVYTPSLRPFFR